MYGSYLTNRILQQNWLKYLTFSVCGEFELSALPKPICHRWWICLFKIVEYVESFGRL